MKKNGKELKGTWIDPDEIPEITDEDLDRADLYMGEKLIRRGRPRSDAVKKPVYIRLDADLLSTIKSSGPGWQTRINEVLRQHWK